MKGIDVNLALESGATPLLAASEGGHVEVVKLLLQISVHMIENFFVSTDTNKWALVKEKTLS